MIHPNTMHDLHWKWPVILRIFRNSRSIGSLLVFVWLKTHTNTIARLFNSLLLIICVFVICQNLIDKFRKLLCSNVPHFVALPVDLHRRYPVEHKRPWRGCDVEKFRNHWAKTTRDLTLQATDGRWWWKSTITLNVTMESDIPWFHNDSSSFSSASQEESLIPSPPPPEVLPGRTWHHESWHTRVWVGAGGETVAESHLLSVLHIPQTVTWQISIWKAKGRHLEEPSICHISSRPIRFLLWLCVHLWEGPRQHVNSEINNN